jgi:uncharacterized protein with HEPN domain
MEKDKVYARHILDAVSAIEKFMAGKDYENFSKDQLLQDGVIRELEIIGEASKHFSDEFKNSMPNLPWQDIAGMRDKLIHDYFSVDLDAVWKVATKDIKELKTEILKKID